MSASNSHVNGKATRDPAPVDLSGQRTQLVSEDAAALLAELEVPFDASLIAWRVTNTAQDKKRGQIIPYADQRAYTDRLNRLFTPAGWTRRYTVHTSAYFQRSTDQKTTAKVFVTCDLTIFGIGSHSATGEGWAESPNACTSAEAQAFKRACSCFGLGRYLYYFTGAFVDLDERKRPKTTPRLTGWATPDGWRRGLRPLLSQERQSTRTEVEPGRPSPNRHGGTIINGDSVDLVHQIEAMAEKLGKGLYRGLLKTVARAWKPGDIKDPAVVQKVLAQMQSAEEGLRRLHAALEKSGAAPLTVHLRSLQLTSLEQVDNLESLHKIVLALEAKAGKALQHR